MERQPSAESPQQFEKRKSEHIKHALDKKNQASVPTGLDCIRLTHEALPDFDFDSIDLSSSLFGRPLKTPFLISSMTAGHSGALDLNRAFANAADSRGWAMGVGSQRRELSDPTVSREWSEIRRTAPHAVLIGNLGITQVVQTPVGDVQKLVESLGATAFIVHLNPLQEVIQDEGTPQFTGARKSLENLVRTLGVPVIAKEVGSGISPKTIQFLSDIGISVIDVAGVGGTHWGRIEGSRTHSKLRARTAETFADWGIPTVESFLRAKSQHTKCDLWASGGLRSGLDAAKFLALGASRVGFAYPLLKAVLESEAFLHETMEAIEFECRTALFCTGCQTIGELQRGENKWQMV